MADLAVLGIKIDASQTVAATTALDKFTAAAKPAAAGASSLEKATQTASAGLAGIGRAGVTAKAGADAITKSGSLARYELINLGRQAQDVGVSLMGGQAPLTVLAQQGSQIFDVFSSSKTGTVNGFFKQLGSGIASVITPARLLVGGVAAIGIGAALAFKSLGDGAKASDDLARSIGITTGQLHGLQGAASFKGISTEDFTKGMSQFGQSVYDAKNNMGSLASVFRANNVSASSFNDYLEKASGLIKNAKDDQTRLQLLQQMGLLATMQWVSLLRQGGEGLRAAVKEAGFFDSEAEARLVASARKFDEAWNKATTNSSNYFKNWALSAWSALDSLSEKTIRTAVTLNRAMLQMTPEQEKRLALTSGQGSALTAKSDVDSLYAGTALAKVTKPTDDPNALARRNATETPLLGLLGQTPTAAPIPKRKEEENDRNRCGISTKTWLHSRRDRRCDVSRRIRRRGVRKQGDQRSTLARRGDVRRHWSRDTAVRVEPRSGFCHVG